MKFKFFGDSWFWSWHAAGTTLKSKSLTNLHNETSALSITQSLLKDLGHDVETFCKPGTSLAHTAHVITRLRDIESPIEKEVWVIFASSDFRIYGGPPLENLNSESVNFGQLYPYPEWDLSDYHRFIDQLDSYMINNLKNIVNTVRLKRESGKNISVIFVGGQSSIPKHVYEKSVDSQSKEYVHLLSENIFNTIMAIPYEKYDSQVDNFPRFVFESDFLNIFDCYVEKHCLNSIDLRIVNAMENADLYRENFLKINYQYIIYPDTVHLGWAGHVLFVDCLMDLCEQKKIINQSPETPEGSLSSGDVSSSGSS